jgi:hypothetical protein
VDSQWPLNGTSSGILAMLNVEGHIYMRNYLTSNHIKKILNLCGFPNLADCIANFRLNEQALDLMAGM